MRLSLRMIYIYTVESPNNVRVGDIAFVHCRDLTDNPRLVHLFIQRPNMHHFDDSFTCTKIG